jgi:hypothetical protein
LPSSCCSILYTIHQALSIEEARKAIDNDTSSTKITEDSVPNSTHYNYFTLSTNIRRSSVKERKHVSISHCSIEKSEKNEYSETYKLHHLKQRIKTGRSFNVSAKRSYKKSQVPTQSINRSRCIIKGQSISIMPLNEEEKKCHKNFHTIENDKEHVISHSICNREIQQEDFNTVFTSATRKKIDFNAYQGPRIDADHIIKWKKHNRRLHYYNNVQKTFAPPLVLI